MKTGVVAAVGALVILSLILMFIRRQAASNEKTETNKRANEPTGGVPLPENLYVGSPKQPPAVFKEGIRSAGSPYGETMPSSGVRWIEASGNLFGMRVLDCRSVTHDMVSTTGDAQIAAKFTVLRSSDGQQHRGSLPMQPLHADAFLKYPTLGRVDSAHLFVAREMEDKWDIYLWDGYLYFARSWTDNLVFRAKVGLSDQGMLISSIDADSQMVNGDPSMAVRQVDFLVKSHLFKRQVPHPLPATLPEDPQQIAMYSIQLYGRWASYATYEETTRSRLKSSP